MNVAVLITALEEIARLRTDLSGDFSMSSRQSDIARAALSAWSMNPLPLAPKPEVAAEGAAPSMGSGRSSKRPSK